MAEPTTKTLDGSSLHAFGGWGAEAGAAEHERPRLRLLHHAFVARIGALSRADAAFDAGEWLTVGRVEPFFVGPGAGGVERPLEDPHISRRQLRVRFLRERRAFEVAPHPDGRRRLGLWVAGEGIRELDRAVEVPPGAAIAIEDRALLGLELARHAGDPDRDRADLVGESDAAWRLREEIADAARFNHPVLVLGETGTGKERVAQAIHLRSARGGRPLVVVNCAALPEALAESLLFGHVKGAFTGAADAREGFFRAAHGGTLFLDELGEMPVSVQPKLLRTLQDGHVTPVGRHDAVSVDVRVVAATNRDPARAIAEGRLREDLYHRLAGHVIHVPTLAARRFDVPELFVAFVAALRRELPGIEWLFRGVDGPPPLPLRFVCWLLSHPWSGNVRELRNVAELCARKNVDGGRFRVPEGLHDAVEASGQGAFVEPSPAPYRPPSPSLPPAEPQGVAGPEAAGPAAASAPDRERLAAASRALGLAQKTVAKLFDADALAALVGGAPGAPGQEPALSALSARLEAAAAERLLALLERHGFEQRALAADLDVSPATLVKLMARFGIPRAMDLDESAVRAALAAEGGDVEAAARRLRVSAQGLKKRLILLRLRES